MKVLVLLSTYNGEKYLQDQLDSLYCQTVFVNILVRDDGSTDSTQEILEENAKNGKLTWYTGENLKPAKSFWDLVQNAPQADYYCFCDQDDVWFKDKVEKAIKNIEEVEDRNQPLLYCSNLVVTDDKLNPIKDLKKSNKVYTDFAHALIYSLAPGCTMVFNQKARNELIKYDMNFEFEIIHDWLAHKIVAMLGSVIYDNDASMFYRQHGNNVIGAKTSKFVRLKRLLTSKECIRSNTAASLLKVYKSQLRTDKIELLQMVANYKNDKLLKKRLKKDKHFLTTKSNNFVFNLLVSLNKV